MGLVIKIKYQIDILITFQFAPENTLKRRLTRRQHGYGRMDSIRSNFEFIHKL